MPGASEKLVFAWVDLVNHIMSVKSMAGPRLWSAVCLLVLSRSSSLGMMFRSGNFLTAFAVSVIPAMLSTVLIVTGQHTVESTPVHHPATDDEPITAGIIAIIWSGNVLIGIACVLPATGSIAEKVNEPGCQT